MIWTLPAGEPMEAGLLTLADAQDSPLAQIDLPVGMPLPSSQAASGGAGDTQTPNSAAQTPGSADGSQFHLPRRGVVGRPLVLQAPVGTQALTYQALVGGKPARLRAASPRALIVEAPGTPGKSSLQVKKEDQIVLTCSR